MKRLIRSDFHLNELKYRENKGKSMLDVDIIDDLFKLEKNMDNFTEEEAIVQLLSSYKNKNYNTCLLMEFRDKYKNLLRWIRQIDVLINPQDFIDYKNNKILTIPQKIIDNIKNITINELGYLPKRFNK